MSTNVHQIANYGVSRDYARLAELAKAHSIICIVTHDGFRDVAKTLYSSFKDGEMWQISARGTGYVWADNVEDFVRKCEIVALEFIEPPTKEN
ncbi:hypothetical protein OKW45_004296 [Paraburkholderia sp. WSM4175]|uniref:hypothetical protein n=1 Tax=Paraburkholderia sp. WSM4175 TaxID=2991072 RepID=UPI003D260D38